MKNKEIWKDIPGYEGLYQVSNIGRVKSLDRISIDKRKLKGKILSETISKYGYSNVSLYQGSKIFKKYLVHRLVMLAFVGESKLPCDHIDNNKLNNKLNNLRYTTQRINASKDRKPKSGYTGVVKEKRKKEKWAASIRFYGKAYRIGVFETKQNAANAYTEALAFEGKSIYKFLEWRRKFDRKKNYYLNKKKKWIVYMKFQTEEDAKTAAKLLKNLKKELYE